MLAALGALQQNPAASLGGNGVDRRSFLRRGLQDLVRGLAGAVEQASLEAGRRLTGGGSYLRPPGALPEPAFLLACTRCRKCLEACGPGAIRLLGPEAGAAMGTPYIDPLGQPCTLCLECTRVCPEGALEALADPRRARMGTAVLEAARCWAHRGLVCDLCYARCPFPEEAIRMEGGVPSIRPEACTGCGQCVYVCPESPPAIRIVPAGAPGEA